MHPTKRCHKGENGKRATRTCTRHSGGHNLAKLIRAPANKTTQPECAWLGDLTWHDMTCPTERCENKRENKQWVSRTWTWHLSGDNLSKVIRAPSNETTQPEHAWLGDMITRCDMTRPTERFHMGANGKQAARTCTMHSGGHNLAKLIRVPSNKMA